MNVFFSLALLAILIYFNGSGTGGERPGGEALQERFHHGPHLPHEGPHGESTLVKIHNAAKTKLGVAFFNCFLFFVC